MYDKLYGFEIRTASQADAGRLAELCTQLGYPSSQQEVARRLQVISGLPDQLLVVAVDQDRMVVGWVHAFIYRVLESDPMVEIGGLVVDQDARGRGAGRGLLEAVEAWAIAQGIEVVSLRSNVLRVEAHEFYRHLGYAVPKTQFTFRKRLSPGVGGSLA